MRGSADARLKPVGLVCLCVSVRVCVCLLGGSWRAARLLVAFRFDLAAGIMGFALLIAVLVR